MISVTVISNVTINLFFAVYVTILGDRRKSELIIYARVDRIFLYNLKFLGISVRIELLYIVPVVFINFIYVGFKNKRL